MRASFVAVAVSLLTAVLPAAAAKSPRRPSVPLRIAFVTFYQPAENAGGDTSENRVRAFLDRASARENAAPFDFELEYVRGNYYQVLRWLRSGEIDGALVSPFTYALLERDAERDGGARPVALAEFTLPDNAGDPAGNRPIYRVVRDGVPLPDPGDELAKCIARTAAAQNPCRFEFVAHLSTTGFLYPLLRAAKQVDSDEAWRNLLAASHFSGWHDTRPVRQGTTLEFSYASKLIPEGKDKPENFVGWRSLMPDRAHKRFVGDILVLSRESTAVKRYGQELRMVVENNDEYGWLTPDGKPPKTPARRYDLAIYPDEEALQTLRDDVRTLFTNPRLEKTLTRWFDDEEYDFTVGELVQLLRNDQIVSGQLDRGIDHASIVLPGGGVRGAYQARVLDALYDHHVLNINYKATPKLTEEEHGRRLHVRSVVGTSGGALVGYLAARRGPFDGRGANLTARWINPDTNEVLVTPMRVFPAFGTLRWLSLMVAILIFAMLTLILIAPHQDRKTISGPPAYVSVAFFLCVLGAPLLVSRLAFVDHRFVPKSEGAAYAAIVLIVHFLHTTLRRRIVMRDIDGDGVPDPVTEETPVPRRWKESLLGFAGLVLSVGVAQHVLRDLTPDTGDSWLSLLSIVLFIFSIVRLAQWRDVILDVQRAKEYAKGLLTLAVFLALTLTIFIVAAAQGAVTPLEMTAEYWKVVAVAAVVAAVAVALLSLKIGILEEGLGLWFGRVGKRSFAHNPIGILLVFGFAGIGAWLLFVAPAVYSGENGAATFRDQARLVGRPQTAFLAAVTTLGDNQDQLAGGYFAYEEGTVDNLSAVHSPSLLPLQPQQLVEAVCASGSPFPIYPGRPVRHGERETTFIDGGFTHLVPIKGAIELEAKQILIISNAARVDRKLVPTKRASMLGLLVTNAGKTVGFLFDRAQATDLGLQKSALVATIAPAWTMDDPFLMDFRADTIRTLVKEAELDATVRRPGRIVSWGQPRVF